MKKFLLYILFFTTFFSVFASLTFGNLQDEGPIYHSHGMNINIDSGGCNDKSFACVVSRIYKNLFPSLNSIIFYNCVLLVANINTDKKSQYINQILYGIIALFFMFTVYGVILLLKNTFSGFFNPDQEYWKKELLENK